MSDDTQHSMEGKAEFDHVYNEADPRPYFRTLGAFDYATPGHARDVFSAMVEDRRQEARNGDDVTVLDVCCSYGINAALLNHDVTLDSLYERYTSTDVKDLSSDELARADADFYREHRRASAVSVVGIDMAEQAVAYGERAGILKAGLSENLEENEPSDALIDHLSDVSLVTVTGGVGYISERTFARIFESCPDDAPPAVAAFALRWVDFQPFAETFERFGLVTEKLDGTTFAQRRFTDDVEREYVLDQLEKMDIDPSGKEADGEYHAELYVSRKPDQADRTPLTQLLADVV